MTKQQAICIVMVIISLAGPLLAQQQADRDKVLSAALSFERARDLAGCYPADAQRTLAPAEESLDAFTFLNPSAETIAALKSSVAQFSRDLANGRTAGSQIPKLIDEKRYLSALALIQDEQTKAAARDRASICGPVLSIWEKQAQREHQAAVELLSQARSLIQTKPKQAIALARGVQLRHAEMPEAENIRLQAEVIKKSLGNPSLRKFVKITVILGGIGAGTYFGYREYLKQNARRSAVQ